MPQHSDWFELFRSYWWLLFPLSWAIGRMVRLWLRHVRAQKALDLLQGYAGQGKEPPAELLKVLQDQDGYTRAQARDWSGWNLSSYCWIPLFLFTGLTAGFTFMAWRQNWDEGRIFVAIIMASLALGFLAALLAGRRDNRTLPPA